MDKIKKRLGIETIKVDIPYLILAIIILGVGILTMISAKSANYSSGMDTGLLSFFKKDIVIIIACVAVGALATIFPWEWLLKFIDVAFAILLILMLLVPFIGDEVNGATRWIFGFQPSEAVKPALVILMAKYIYRLPKSFRTQIGPSIMMLLPGAAMALIAVGLQKHMSCAIILVMLTGIILLVSGLNRKILLAGVVAVAVAIPAILFFGDGFRGDRINAWLDPFNPEYSGATSWQIIQSLYAIGSGGLLGRGYMQSREKYNWLPMADNDYIFSVFAEEFGFVFCVLLIALFVAFIWRGVYISANAPNAFLSVMAFGITMMFAIQILLNICIVCNVLPPTGVQLPFFSSGGTSLIVSVACVGLVLNVSRYQVR